MKTALILLMAGIAVLHSADNVTKTLCIHISYKHRVQEGAEEDSYLYVGEDGYYYDEDGNCYYFEEEGL